ncbi:hypothetical protein LCGC14_1218060 [marine sediment metagenome]|uniref:Uncharacterized protein n=1 Tax=marine sediment metagenome TaxID=412755 RepID=A0A0F9LZD9_9ZZZZ
MPEQRTTIQIFKSTHRLLARIIAMPDNGRKVPMQVDILVRAEAARLGLILHNSETGSSIGPCPDDSILADDVGRDDRPLTGICLLVPCPECNENLPCTNPECHYGG